ncbi:putative ribonuclease H-like domain-containing protein [Tanacetum coccineum]|uniref:Ribonuclease H-like domain-containing protein n=1 Tax=Tanacetum coccineum TaxID=301880 RepID=A0ABQ5GRJ6_9ASTR
MNRCLPLPKLEEHIGSSGYDVLVLISLWLLVKSRHGYAVSSCWIFFQDDFVDVNESVSESIVEKPIVETNEPKTPRKENGTPIVEDWVFWMWEKMSRSPFNKITAANNSNVTKKVNTVKGTKVNTARPKVVLNAVKGNKGNVVKASACRSKSVMAWAHEEKDSIFTLMRIDRGFVAFGGNFPKEELKFNLFSVSQMCDKKNSVLFTDNECVVLSSDFKLTDESHVSLKVPRKDNMYSVDLRNVVPRGGLTCLFAKATSDESELWHRRLGHVNFKTMNKLSLMKKMYCVVVTDDFNRFSWVFFLVTKDETSEILKTFITCIENLIDPRVKVIRSDNGTEFKNRVMNPFCEMKSIKRAFSVARTPQQNRVAKRKNKTLIKAARTMLSDLKLPTTFWTEAVNTACYVQNRVLVIKPHNKTPYKLFLSRKPALSFMRPFGCPVTILNTIDHLGKFDGKADEGFFVGYSTNSKAFIVFNSRTRIVEENMHVQFSENTPNIARSRPNWLFYIDSLTKSMNYKLVVAGNQSNSNADLSFSSSSKSSPDAGFNPSGEKEQKNTEDPGNESEDLGKDSEVPTEPKKVIQALKDPSWIEAMQEELLNNKDERVARIKAIKLFLACALYKDFVVYQMDVKSAFLYGKTEVTAAGYGFYRWRRLKKIF